MSIWSKVLVGLIFVATLPFFYLSLRLLKTNDAWRKEANQWQASVKQVTGGPPDLDTLAQEVRDARGQLHDIVVDRGRVWSNVNPERAFNSNTGKGTVVVEQPAPHRLTPKMVLFVFDPNSYLGEFQVAEAGDTTVSLDPSIKMSDRQLKRLSTSAGNWTMYEVMPIDRHGIFTGLDKEALTKMLPPDRVDAYVRDQQEAQPGDPPQRVFDGKYERQLTDFNMLFHELNRQISMAADMKLAAEKDVASMTSALANAKQQVAFHDAEIADTKKELARSEAERDLMKAQCLALSNEIAKSRNEMKVAFHKNRALAERWAEIQTRLAEASETETAATQ